MPFGFDEVHLALLSELQRDASRGMKELMGPLAKRGYPLNEPAIRARAKKLSDLGFIDRTVAVLNAKKLGFDLYFMLVKFSEDPRDEKVARDIITSIPEVVEFHTLFGPELHGVLKIRAQDQERVEEISLQLRGLKEIAKLDTLVVGKTHKEGTALPLDNTRALPLEVPRSSNEADTDQD